MKIQVNSDKSISLDSTLASTLEAEVSRILSRFAPKLTRVEVHLSDVDSSKTGQADKRCLIKVRPTGGRPLTTTATAMATESDVSEALKKMQRSLTTFFGRKGRAATEIAPVIMPTKSAVKRAAPITKKKAAAKKPVAKKTAVKKQTKLSPRGPKKKANLSGPPKISTVQITEAQSHLKIFCIPTNCPAIL
jgi:hypothetical protein